MKSYIFIHLQVTYNSAAIATILFTRSAVTTNASSI